MLKNAANNVCRDALQRLKMGKAQSDLKISSPAQGENTHTHALICVYVKEHKSKYAAQPGEGRRKSFGKLMKKVKSRKSKPRNPISKFLWNL